MPFSMAMLNNQRVMDINGYQWIKGCNVGSTLQISPVDGRLNKCIFNEQNGRPG